MHAINTQVSVSLYPTYAEIDTLDGLVVNVRSFKSLAGTSYSLHDIQCHAKRSYDIFTARSRCFQLSKSNIRLY